MLPSNLFSGDMGQIVATTISSTMLFMMLAMTLRLYTSRKRRTYLSLTTSLLWLFAEHLVSIYELLRTDLIASNLYVLTAAHIIGVQLLLISFYQLYNPSMRFQAGSLYGLMGLSIILVFLRYVTTIAGSDLILQIYFFLFLLFLLLWMPAQVGQSVKYRLGLLFFIVGESVSLFSHNSLLWGAIQYYLSAAAFFVFFLILFERVVELLQNISRSSITDPLTGLYNRRYFDSKVKQFLDRGRKVFVLFSDIDNFKKLNDTQGHDMGDKILKQVANILQEECDRIGIAGRYGGEEMVALITDPRTDMAKFAESIRARVQSETIVTVSLGCSVSMPGITLERLIKQADEGMYKAKTTGKNKVVMFSF